MWRSLVHRVSALIDGVDATDLCGTVQRWKREICVASGLGEYLHFIVYAAVLSACRIRESPVPVYECVHRLVFAGSPRKTAVLFSQNITKLLERAPETVRTIRFINAVVKVHLYFTESLGLHLREQLEQRSMVLFG